MQHARHMSFLTTAFSVGDQVPESQQVRYRCSNIHNVSTHVHVLLNEMLQGSH